MRVSDPIEDVPVVSTGPVVIRPEHVDPAAATRLEAASEATVVLDGSSPGSSAWR